MNIVDTPDPEPEEAQRALTLDLATIGVINAHLKRIKGNTPLEKFHGTILLRIVKGQFAAIEPGYSELLIDNKKKQVRKTA